MRNLKITVAYDGENYVGWQFQPNGVSVQEKLEQAWLELTQETIRITASGRTDSGVHARGQVCSIKTESDLELEKIPRALTAQTPYDISVLKAELAPDDFHPIRDSVSKTYRYQIQFGPILDVHSRKQRWHVPRTLDPERMRAAAAILVGTHEYDSFQTKGSDRLTTERTITQLDVIHTKEREYDFIDVVVTADGFLYNMVRCIAGTLVKVGLGKREPEWVSELLAKKDRTIAGETAPAHGLFLEKVVYE